MRRCIVRIVCGWAVGGAALGCAGVVGKTEGAGGLGSVGTGVITVRPSPGWATSAVGQRFDTVYRPSPTQPEVRGQSSVSPQTRLTLNGVIAVRQAVAALAAEHGLSPVTPTARDHQDGWTEVLTRADGARIRMREDTLGREVQIDVREGRSGPRLRPLVAQRVGASAGR